MPHHPTRLSLWRACGLALSLSLLPLLRSEEAKIATPRLSDCVNQYDPARATKTPTGSQFWFVGRDLADGKTLKMSVVGPHLAIHEPHRHAEDEFFFILEGQAEVFLNGEKTIIGPYSSFYCPSGSLHGIKNAGDGTLRYLVIKKYNPDNPNAAPTKS